ncbi:MAG: hypothetical protein ABI333_12525 [bacterium]
MRRLTVALGVLGLLAAVGCGGDSTAGPVCGNDEQQTGEECDGADLAGETCASLGLDDGTLACRDTCRFDASQCTGTAECGNGELEYPEACDGADLAGTSCTDLGFDGGSLGCAGDCAFDTSGCDGTPDCGDGVIAAPEECDGSNFGGATCSSLGLGAGDLACTASCAVDTSGCAVQPECGNGEAEAGEDCDGSDLDGNTCAGEGFAGGTLACGTSCALDTTGCTLCGNDVQDAGEECDGTDLDGNSCVDRGYTGGTLTCGTDCAFDETACTSGACGNGTLETGEACDGADLGGATCVTRGYDGGFLGCTGSCAFDESLCSNCESTDITAPVASGHVPAPETQGTLPTTTISVDLFDACGIDTTSIVMVLSVTPPFGPAFMGPVATTLTGSGSNVTVTHTPSSGFMHGSLVEVQVTAADNATNTLVETWRFTVETMMTLYTGGSGGTGGMSLLDQGNPTVNTTQQGDYDLGVNGGNDQRVAVRFGGSVPAGALILEATLFIGICPPGAGVATTVDCYQLNADWSPNQCTWNNATNSTPWNTGGADGVPQDRVGAAGASISVPNGTPAYTELSGGSDPIPVAWAAGDTNFGILCTSAATTTIPMCGEFSNYPPRMEIRYGPPLP